MGGGTWPKKTRQQTQYGLGGVKVLIFDRQTGVGSTRSGRDKAKNDLKEESSEKRSEGGGWGGSRLGMISVSAQLRRNRWRSDPS